MAQRFAQETQGVVGFRLHRVLDVHAGFAQRHEDLVLTGIYDNGRVVKVRIVSYTIDAKPASSSEDAAMAQAYDDPKPGQVFELPFDSRYFRDYSYDQAGPQTIAFNSNVRDAAHGNGTFTYDANNTVVSYTYQPNALPPHARLGSITDHRAEVLPNYWAVTHETQRYSGSYFLFAGAATEQVEYSGFSRFPDLQSALQSL